MSFCLFTALETLQFPATLWKPDAIRPHQPGMSQTHQRSAQVNKVTRDEVMELEHCVHLICVKLTCVLFEG